LVLENYFLGKLRGTGTCQDSEHGTRTATFSGIGTLIPGGLRLTYDVVFSDGERQHKVWTFMKAGDGHYIGRRDDVVGDAQITQSGDDIHMSYKARVATNGGVKNVSFDEHFTLTASGTIVNQLTASYLFLSVANSEITIHKAATRSPLLR
jgi:hypothetical protein